uniref:Phosphatidylcholine transfer protein n=1 Tax=Sus scrofa TaxID=9823 RepID=A0A8D0PN80_PIG
MDPGAGCFSEEQFREACAELQHPSLSGAKWELLVETLGISIYRQLDQQTGLYEYKVFGVLEDCSPELLADVYMDLDYRKQWDEYVKGDERNKIVSLCFWLVDFPSRRELDFEGKKVLVILAWSTSVLQFPEKSGVIRVKQYKQSLAIQSDGKKGSKVFMCYFDNPGGQIPSWLINWAAKSGVPNFLKDMSKACQNYRKKT